MDGQFTGAQTYKRKMKKKYFEIERKCPFCNEKFICKNGGCGFRQFCSKSCSAKSRKPSAEQKVAISKTLVEFNKANAKDGYVCKYEFPIRKCTFCLNDFQSLYKNQKFCNHSCHSSFRKHSEKSKQKARESHLKLVEVGLHKGWSNRSNKKPSFPESVVIEILERQKISYTKEFPHEKWFIDFSNEQQKIALEIDGKQHDEPSRKESDERKDASLQENGWSVHRIRWQKLTPEFYAFLESEILRIFRTVTVS